MYFNNINLVVNENEITTSKVTDLKVLKDTYEFVSSLEKMVQFIYKDRMKNVRFQTGNNNYGEFNIDFYKKETVLGEDKDVKDILISNMNGNASYDTTFMYNSNDDTCHIYINDPEICNKFLTNKLAIPYNDGNDFIENNQIDFNITYIFQAIENSLKYIARAMKYLHEDSRSQTIFSFVDELLDSNLIEINPEHLSYIWCSLPQNSPIREKIAEYTNKKAELVK